MVRREAPTFGKSRSRACPAKTGVFSRAESCLVLSLHRASDTMDSDSLSSHENLTKLSPSRSVRLDISVLVAVAHHWGGNGLGLSQQSHLHRYHTYSEAIRFDTHAMQPSNWSGRCGVGLLRATVTATDKPPIFQTWAYHQQQAQKALLQTCTATATAQQLGRCLATVSSSKGRG